MAGLVGRTRVEFGRVGNIGLTRRLAGVRGISVESVIDGMSLANAGMNGDVMSDADGVDVAGTRTDVPSVGRNTDVDAGERSMLDVSAWDTEPLGLIITLPAAESNRPVESDELGAMPEPPDLFGVLDTPVRLPPSPAAPADFRLHGTAPSPASGDAAVGGLSLATFILECEHKDLAIERE